MRVFYSQCFVFHTHVTPVCVADGGKSRLKKSSIGGKQSPRLFMRAMMALVLHLGDVGKCVRLIWDWSVHDQESGYLHTLGATFIMWRK